MPTIVTHKNQGITQSGGRWVGSTFFFRDGPWYHHYCDFNLLLLNFLFNYILLFLHLSPITLHPTMTAAANGNGVRHELAPGQ